MRNIKLKIEHCWSLQNCMQYYIVRNMVGDIKKCYELAFTNIFLSNLRTLKATEITYYSRQKERLQISYVENSKEK